MDTTEFKPLLDVEAVLAAKNPKLAKRVPKFLINALKRIIHSDDMNKFYYEHRHDNGIDFATATVAHFNATCSAINEENIPKTGRYILVSNHPLGGLDGVALISIVGQYRKDLKFPVNDILLALKTMDQIFIPINKHGRNSAEGASQFEEAFQSDNLVLYFPAGLCSRKVNGQIQDLEWKKTIVKKARQYQRDIIPVYFNGRNSNFFYNIARLRKALGIKANLEMLFLPGEMYKQSGAHFTATFGKPISYTSFTKEKTDMQWAAYLREEVYKLAKEPTV